MRFLLQLVLVVIWKATQFFNHIGDAADIVEASNLNYTVIRPGWFTGGPVNYEITHKGEPFGGPDVSIKSIVDLVTKLLNDDELYSCESIGINKPS